MTTWEEKNNYSSPSNNYRIQQESAGGEKQLQQLRQHLQDSTGISRQATVIPPRFFPSTKLPPGRGSAPQQPAPNQEGLRHQRRRGVRNQAPASRTTKKGHTTSPRSTTTNRGGDAYDTRDGHLGDWMCGDRGRHISDDHRRPPSQPTQSSSQDAQLPRPWIHSGDHLQNSTPRGSRIRHISGPQTNIHHYSATAKTKNKFHEVKRPLVTQSNKPIKQNPLSKFKKVFKIQVCKTEYYGIKPHH